MKRTGLSLVIFGVLGVLFFWITDPRYGLISRISSIPLLSRIAPSGNIIDDANNAIIGTFLGIAGCAILALLGAYLLIRRPA